MEYFKAGGIWGDTNVHNLTYAVPDTQDASNTMIHFKCRKVAELMSSQFSAYGVPSKVTVNGIISSAFRKIKITSK